MEHAKQREEFEAEHLSSENFLNRARNEIGIPPGTLQGDQLAKLYNFRADSITTEATLQIAQDNYKSAVELIDKASGIIDIYKGKYQDARQHYLDTLSEVEKIQMENDRASSEKVVESSETYSKLLADEALGGSQN